MQQKVSIIVPCYNKVNYISGMFESITAQKWDNIELILVNDGSTDGTREIIESWLPKFRARGFEVVLVDQDNLGLAAAVHEGLKRASGEFVSQVDADDELSPEYVSTMAGWLAEHPEYDWAACDYILISDGCNIYHQIFPLGEEHDLRIEKWLLSRINHSICIYMIRRCYLERLKVVESFYRGREGSQEPQLFFPLALGEGKIKYFRAPLYKYIFYEPETHLSSQKSVDETVKHRAGFFKTVNEVIRSLPIGDNEKRRLYSISELAYLMYVLKASLDRGFDPPTDAVESLLTQVSLFFTPDTLVHAEFAYIYPRLLCAAIGDNILDVKPQNFDIPSGRVIAWGALGKNARALLPSLKGTRLEPAELWDAVGDGVFVKKPDPARLGADDLVLVLPSRSGDIPAALEPSPCGNIMVFDDILTYLAASKFPEFYSGRVCFRF